MVLAARVWLRERERDGNSSELDGGNGADGAPGVDGHLDGAFSSLGRWKQYRAFPQKA